MTFPDVSPFLRGQVYRESRMSFDSGFPIGTLGNSKIGHSQYIGPGPENQVFCFQIKGDYRFIFRDPQGGLTFILLR